MSAERGRYYDRGTISSESGRGRGPPSHRGGTPTRRAWGSRDFYRGGATVFGSRGKLDNPPGRAIMDGLVDKPLKTLQRDAVSKINDTAITNLEYVASYNWTESEEPTIIVPGTHLRPSVERGLTAEQAARACGSIRSFRSRCPRTLVRHSSIKMVIACHLHLSCHCSAP